MEKTPAAAGLLVDERGGLRFEAQSQWRVLMLVAFFTGGLGAGVYVASWALNFVPGMILGLFLVAVIKGGAHIAYLGRPERCWRALKRPRTSWISRGLIGMAIYVVCGTLYVIFRLPPLGWVSVAAAVVVMSYAGYLMAFSPAIPFWNSSLLPVLFLVFSAESGTALAIPLYATFTRGVIQPLEMVETLLLVLVGMIVFSYLYGAYHSSLSARESVLLLMRGSLGALFFIGVVLFGFVVPLTLAFLNGAGTASLVSMWLAAFLVIQGALSFRWVILRAGVYAPPRY